ncbi:Imm21 family immunity protein [Streptomyces sp. NBC_00316]|uniref:Imm21 family immunity protein n=1 Tax=Streptomyces sp. NBC_00316 TaxID=2975710 RepID=UPI002E28E31D|nr:Imm21 family immunity protein [Streptomyces sp. NBC_00316]
MSDATPRKPLLWVESGGGPLVVVPESALASWCTDTEATSADEFSGWGDYDRACQIDDYIGTLHVGCAEALVLADSPDTTTFLPDRMLFIRWSGADSESDILAALEPALTLAEWQSPVQWTLPAGPVVLFEDGAETTLKERGYGYGRLRSTATDMDTMKINYKGRRTSGAA